MFTLAACGEVITETYATWQEASDAGAVRRNWMRSFVPTSAIDLKDTHDLDSNAQTLLFTVQPSQVPAMVRGMRNLTKTETTVPQKILDALRLDPAEGKAVDGHLVCDEGELGFLFVHTRTGRSAYTNVLSADAETVAKTCSTSPRASAA